MKASIKITSVGGATIPASQFGSADAGSFNFPIETFAAFDGTYGGNKVYILVNSPTNGKFDSGSSSYAALVLVFSTANPDQDGTTKAITDAVKNNNGSGESIIQLPSGVTCTGWYWDNILY